MNGALPVDSEGTAIIPRMPTKEYVRIFMREHYLEEDVLCEHFTSMVNRFF